MKVHKLKIKAEYAYYKFTKEYEITYITNYEQKDGYVVFAEKEIGR